MKYQVTAFFFLATVVSLVASGCSQAAIHADKTKVVTRGTTEIKLDSEDPNLVKTLEDQLVSVHSEKVTLPAEVLRSLIRNEKGRRSQLRDLSGQLEAIKNIDVQETGGSKR